MPAHVRQARRLRCHCRALFAQTVRTGRPSARRAAGPRRRRRPQGIPGGTPGPATGLPVRRAARDDHPGPVIKAWPSWPGRGRQTMSSHAVALTPMMRTASRPGPSDPQNWNRRSAPFSDQPRTRFPSRAPGSARSPHPTLRPAPRASSIFRLSNPYPAHGKAIWAGLRPDSGPMATGATGRACDPLLARSGVARATACGPAPARRSPAEKTGIGPFAGRVTCPGAWHRHESSRHGGPWRAEFAWVGQDANGKARQRMSPGPHEF